MREVRNLDDGLRRGCPVGCRGGVVEHTRIGCRRPPCGVFPTPVGICLRNLGDHIHLAHLRMNGHALRTKRRAQAARRRHIQVELRKFVRPCQDFLGRTEHGNAPRPKYRNTIGLGGLFHKVRNHHDGHAAIVQRVASLHEALASTRIEHRRSLVQYEHARFHGEHTGKRHALLLATRKCMGLVALKAHQAHALQRLAYTLRNLCRWHAKVFGTKRNVIFDKRCHQLVIGILEYHARGRTNVVDQLGVGRIHAVDAYRARIGLQ